LRQLERRQRTGRRRAERRHVLVVERRFGIGLRWKLWEQFGERLGVE
jgi:hypothetical protein